MGQNFFRIVEPAHLIIVPLICLSVPSHARRKHNKNGAYYFYLYFNLVLNLSRGYFLCPWYWLFNSQIQTLGKMA
jgi:hypothetical protein